MQQERAEVFPRLQNIPVEASRIPCATSISLRAVLKSAPLFVRVRLICTQSAGFGPLGLEVDQRFLTFQGKTLARTFMKFLSHLFDNNRKWAAKIKRKAPEYFERPSKIQQPVYLWLGLRR
jgi:hypothetical protein